MNVPRAGLAVAVALLLAGCSADQEPAAPAPAPVPAAVPDGRVAATLDGVDLVLEVADTPDERAVGLMRRQSVPPGTGMVFRYDAPNDGRFYMFMVPVALQAVFVRDGRVVSSIVMPPCRETEPQACPTYGADGPFDTVVETAPETLPVVAPGDLLRLSP